jgi:hypothetical protein
MVPSVAIFHEPGVIFLLCFEWNPAGSFDLANPDRIALFLRNGGGFLKQYRLCISKKGKPSELPFGRPCVAIFQGIMCPVA